MKTNLTALFKNRPVWQSRQAAQEGLEEWNIFLLQPFSMFVYENKKFVKLPDDERGNPRKGDVCTPSPLMPSRAILLA